MNNQERQEFGEVEEKRVPIISEEQRLCEHDFENVTEERRALVEQRELPEWAKLLREKEDPRWKNPKDKYKTLLYLKCRKCGLLRVKDEEPSAREVKENEG